MFQVSLCPSSEDREYYTGGCCLWYLVLSFSSCYYGVELMVMCPVWGLLQLMMGIVVPETWWASNKICNKNHLLHLVGILFPHTTIVSLYLKIIEIHFESIIVISNEHLLLLRQVCVIFVPAFRLPSKFLHSYLLWLLTFFFTIIERKNSLDISQPREYNIPTVLRGITLLLRLQCT
jgi:hypothetical protein